VRKRDLATLYGYGDCLTAAAPGGAGETVSEQGRRLVEALTKACGQGTEQMRWPYRQQKLRSLLVYIADVERRAGAGEGSE
jgi:hypothetical protein